MLERGNLFRNVPERAADEHFDILLRRPGLRIERIVSHGHASPPDFWYDQPADEWVVVLSGSAVITYENGEENILMPGDWFFIPTHRRHRVSRTSAGEPTVWLAVHIDAQAGIGPQ